MARVILHQRNPWGRQVGGDGEEPQRADLWVINLGAVALGLAAQLGTPIVNVPSYFAQSVSFPDLNVKADQFRRDSRPYSMPGFDEAPEPVRVTFILDAPAGGKSSRIQSLLTRWRSLVRAGRGAMSNENEVTLNANYSIDYTFDIGIRLLKGGQAAIRSVLAGLDAPSSQVAGAVPVKARGNLNVFSIQRDVTNQSQQQAPRSGAEAVEQQNTAQRKQAQAAAEAAIAFSPSQGVDNDLQASSHYTLKKAWLGGFKLSDLTYVGSQISTIEARFYVEDVLDVNETRLSR